MKRFFQNNKIILGLIILCCILVNTVSFYAADFRPMLSDMVAASCSVKEIKDFGQITDDVRVHSYSGPGYCWAKNTYPFIKIFLGQFSLLSSLSVERTVVILYIFLSGLIPLVFFLIGKLLFDNEKIGLIAAFFGAFAPVLARIINITPQNLFGILLILCFILFFIKYDLEKEKKYLILMGLILLLIGIFHHLSFSVLFFALLVYFFIKGIKRPRFFIILLLIAPFILLILFFLGGNNFIYYILANITEGGSFWRLGQITPLWLYPSIVGYIVIIFSLLGLIGIIINWSKLTKQKNVFIFLFSMIGFLIFLTQLYYIGITFFNFRFIAFLFIPVVIFACYGFYWLLNIMRKNLNQKFIYAWCILIFLAGFMHYFGYRQDEFITRNKYVFANDKFISIISWIKNNAKSNDKILIVFPYSHKEASSLAYLINNEIYIIDDDLKNDDLYSKKINNGDYYYETYLGKLLSKNNFVQKQRKEGYNNSLIQKNGLAYLDFILEKPDSKLAKNYFQEYNLDFILLYCWTDANKNIKKSKSFEKIYCENNWNIYKLK